MALYESGSLYGIVVEVAVRGEQLAIKCKVQVRRIMVYIVCNSVML